MTTRNEERAHAITVVLLAILSIAALRSGWALLGVVMAMLAVGLLIRRRRRGGRRSDGGGDGGGDARDPCGESPGDGDGGGDGGGD